MCIQYWRWSDRPLWFGLVVLRWRDGAGWLGLRVKERIMTLGRGRARRITWRTGSRQQQGQPRMMSGRFVFCRVRQADAGTRGIYKGHDWPECWLIAEWPPGAPEPTRYWLSNLPATTRRADLVRAAKLRCPSSPTTTPETANQS